MVMPFVEMGKTEDRQIWGKGVMEAKCSVLEMLDAHR